MEQASDGPVRSPLFIRQVGTCGDAYRTGNRVGSYKKSDPLSALWTEASHLLLNTIVVGITLINSSITPTHKENDRCDVQEICSHVDLLGLCDGAA